MKKRSPKWQTLLHIIIGVFVGIGAIKLLEHWFPGFEGHPIVIGVIILGAHITWLLTRDQAER